MMSLHCHRHTLFNLDKAPVSSIQFKPTALGARHHHFQQWFQRESTRVLIINLATCDQQLCPLGPIACVEQHHQLEQPTSFLDIPAFSALSRICFSNPPWILCVERDRLRQRQSAHAKMSSSEAPDAKSDEQTQIHLHYLSQALDLARLSPPKPTNFRVGCVIVSFPTSTSASTSTFTPTSVSATSGPSPPPPPGRPQGQVLSTGYTLELEGNTHAEQNALTKLATSHNTDEAHLHELPALAADQNVTLYTTLEPCGLRLSGNQPCVERIIATRKTNNGNVSGIQQVIFGAREPGTFVKDSKSLARLDEAGVPWEFVPNLQDEILKVATEGHHRRTTGTGDGTAGGGGGGGGLDDISPEERARQEALPRNPKKRMMEVDVPPR